jgi:hypothetical protein
MILSALQIVDKRCAITNVVRPVDERKQNYKMEVIFDIVYL